RPVIGCSPVMFIEQSLHKSGVEQTSSPHRFRREEITHESTCFLSEPERQRHGKTSFLARQDFRRNPRLAYPLQKVFSGETLDFQLARKPRSEFHELVIE